MHWASRQFAEAIADLYSSRSDEYLGSIDKNVGKPLSSLSDLSALAISPKSPVMALSVFRFIGRHGDCSI
jgi:hypothetical protein